VLRLLTLLLRWPGLLCLVLAAGRACGWLAGSGPSGVAARLAVVPWACLAPAGLRRMSALAAGSLAAGRRVPAGRRLRGRGGGVVPVLPVFAGAACLVLAGLLVLAGDERLGLLG
jgi:hypothetical protein